MDWNSAFNDLLTDLGSEESEDIKTRSGEYLMCLRKNAKILVTAMYTATVEQNHC